MAKRFTDTDKWKKPFIRGLSGAYKLLWLYICDDCDHAGIWQIDMDVARIRIGENVTIEESIKTFGDKIQPIDGGTKWFIPSFLEFQYPSGLNPQNNAHAGIIKILEKYNLLKEENKPLISPSRGALDKDMVKEMDMVKDKVVDKKKEDEIKLLSFDLFWNQYDKKIGKEKTQNLWMKLSRQDVRDILIHVPRYVESTPNGQFRKNPETYLRNKSWNDEIINKQNSESNGKSTQGLITNTTYVAKPGKVFGQL